MSYWMNDVMGASIDEPNETQIREIVSSLQTLADDEHPDVSLEHESGWGLSIYVDGTLLWENVEDSSIPPREITLDSWDEVIEVLLKLSRGDIDAVNQLDWQE
ncbi:hypothetical protein [Streptomyces sp. R35]|uniref:Uncharacterized protein n=1 Tax=Streptomyces sp. R35 TaxID=3238630 RepID=A0AB39S726_9ACTN